MAVETVPSGVFSVSRAELLSSSVPDDQVAIDAAPVLAAAKRVAGDSNMTFSVAIATPGRLSRVDVWVTRDVLVTHGYARDHSEDTAGSVHVGPAEVISALAALMAPVQPSNGEMADEPSGSVRSYGSLSELIEEVVDPDPKPAVNGPAERLAILSVEPDDPDSERLVVASGSALRWGKSRGDGPIDLSVDRLADLWARLMRLIP